MSETTFTTEQWQSTFKSKDATETPEALTANKTDEFDARLNRIVAYAGQVAVREYQYKILSVLHDLDRVNAGVANEMMRAHASEEATERFNSAWDGLKRLIYEIERREINNDKAKNQLEA